MGKEAYTVSYDKANYHAPVRGENRVDALRRREEDIRNGMLSYLKEYRLGVKFDEFYYRIEKDSYTGEEYLSSNESGPVRDKFRNAIADRKSRGLSARREEAECLGFERLEKELTTAKERKLFVWVSPPGVKAEGYGDYSFTFAGQVITGDNGNQKVRVIPYRNVLSQKEHRDYLLKLDQNAENFQSDIDFLGNPIVFSTTPEIKTPEEILRFIGEKEKVSTEWSQRILSQVDPLIQKYIDLVKQNAEDSELIKVRNAIENYTLYIKDTINNKGGITERRISSRDELMGQIKRWEYTPPQAAGSCGSSASKSTLMEFQETNKWEYHTGDCVCCGAKNTDVGPCSICKECEKKFDEKEKYGK